MRCSDCIDFNIRNEGTYPLLSGWCFCHSGFPSSLFRKLVWAGILHFANRPREYLGHTDSYFMDTVSYFVGPRFLHLSVQMRILKGYVSGLQGAAGCCLQHPAIRTQPSAPNHTDNLKTKAPNTTGSDHLYNNLELLMMDIMVSETCWASNKICNKYHLLHLVGILFPHIK